MNDFLYNINNGRSAILMENGLDADYLDSLSLEEDKLNYIKNYSINKKKNNYLYSLAVNRHLPDLSNGIQFNSFYKNAPQTTGDSAEVALELYGIGKGYNIKREVSTDINSTEEFNIFGINEKLNLKHRYSDLVLYNSDGTNTHIESKVGLTRGNKKKYDIRQEFYGDYYRLMRDPDSNQVYTIFRNKNNGHSELEDKDFVYYLKTMHDIMGDRVKIFYEGKNLTNNELENLLNNNNNDLVENYFEKPKLNINNKSCSIFDNVICESLDKNIRSVNHCDVERKSSVTNFFIDSHSKTSNFANDYAIGNSSIISNFFSGMKVGVKSSFGDGLISNAIEKLVWLANSNEDSSKGEIEAENIIKNTFLTAVKKGVITGCGNVINNMQNSQVSNFLSNVFSSSSKIFKDFCNNKIGVDDMLQEVIKKTAIVGFSALKTKILSSGMSKMASVGLGNMIKAGTSKVCNFLTGSLKVISGAFLGAVLISALLGLGEENPEVKIEYDPRVAVRVEINDNGICNITSDLPDDIIDSLVQYNKEANYLNKRIEELENIRKTISNNEIIAKEKIIQELKINLNVVEKKIIRMSKNIAKKNSCNFNKSIENEVNKFIENKMGILNKQNATLKDLEEVSKRYTNEIEQSKFIKDCCNQITKINIDSIQSNKIRNIINEMVKVVDNTNFIYKSNKFVSTSDILLGCSIGG